MLLANGKPVLGFLNQWLYSGGSAAFTDITSGSAIGCNTTGFPAQVGWDAVTGFGTPVSILPCEDGLVLTHSELAQISSCGDGQWNMVMTAFSL